MGADPPDCINTINKNSGTVRVLAIPPIINPDRLSLRLALHPPPALVVRPESPNNIAMANTEETNAQVKIFSGAPNRSNKNRTEPNTRKLPVEAAKFCLFSEFLGLAIKVKFSNDR